MKSGKGLIAAACVLTTIFATAAAVTVTLANTLADTAINKIPPRSFKPIKQKVENKMKGRELKTEIDDVSHLITESVAIINRDGLRLSADYYAADDPKRIIIAMHGWRSNWKNDFGALLEFYHNIGCSVLLPDQRTQGTSEGEYIGFGVFERYDCRDWVEYVTQKFGTDIPVYLCGVSMGATTVLMSASLDLPENVCGIISDCAFTSPDDIWSHVVTNNLRIGGKFTLSLAKRRINRNARYRGNDASTLDSLRNTDIPVLFIHGEKDSLVPVEMTYENYNACASEKDILIVKDADHGMSYHTDTISYQTAVKNFFKKHDRTARF